MLSRQFKDLIAILALVGLVAYLAQGPSRPKEIPAALAPTPAIEQLTTFTLVNVEGEEIRYDGHKPLIITLTATTCVGCQQRLGTDRLLYEKAKALKIPLYNILVYADRAQAARFVKQFAPHADQYLADPGGQIGVGQFLGSDEQCWLLVKDGRIVYRGEARLGSIQGLLDSVGAL